MTSPDSETQRSYGCTFGCGNAYDFVFISVRDGTTEFLCVPCFLRLAYDILSAMTESTPEQVAHWLKAISPLDPTPMKGNRPRPGRRNAPATTDDADLFEAYDSTISADDLPAEFR